jgi:hypothetical protein
MFKSASLNLVALRSGIQGAPNIVVLFSNRRGMTVMTRCLLFAVATLALISRASALDSINDWVLLTLGWENGAGAVVLNNGLVPEFATKGACQTALRRELQKHSGLSHAEGGGSYYLCTHLRDWVVSE